MINSCAVCSFCGAARKTFEGFAASWQGAGAIQVFRLPEPTVHKCWFKS